MEASTTMDIQKRPAARQIQPIGFLGRLEAIRAPTRGKARKGKKITRPLRDPAVPHVLEVEGCVAAPTDREERVSAAPTTNMATKRAASDHANQATWSFVPTTLVFCCPVPAVTAPLYKISVSRTLRKRFGQRAPHRVSEYRPKAEFTPDLLGTKTRSVSTHRRRVPIMS
jgi:hypothetical protein